MIADSQFQRLSKRNIYKVLIRCVLLVQLCFYFPVQGAEQLASTEPVCSQDDGYRGIWYMNQPSKDEYKFKYSGGFATYPQQQVPIAYYCKEVDKTFFCYGGTTAHSGKDKQVLLHMVSYYDHKTGMVPRPTILLNKHTDDAHDNPTLMVDDKGFIWIFSASHGTARPSYIHRSRKPYSIDAFDRILTTNFSYAEPWWLPGKGFLFLHTRYVEGRNLFWMTSPDGEHWNDPLKLAYIDMGDYQISWRNGTRLATAFDFHPAPLGLNGRANLYYLETRDDGQTWTTADGKALKLPLNTTNNPALIYDSRAEGLLVYLKDIAFETNGNPVILFLTSKGFESGPKNDPRTWKTARWTGTNWEFKVFTTSHNNYDHGSLYIESDGTWRIIAPTETGPQPYNPGGEVVMWTSRDRGSGWQKVRQLTSHSPRNHTYVRKPVNAHPDFYALWADGNARQPSESFLYFTNQKGDHVWRLPGKMAGDFAAPEPVE
jgi:BNR repeat-containing family member